MAANTSTISARNNLCGNQAARKAASRNKFVLTMLSAAVAVAYPLTLFAQTPPQREAVMPQVIVEGQGERVEGRRKGKARKG